MVEVIKVIVYSVILVKTGLEYILYTGGGRSLRSDLGNPKGNTRDLVERLEPGVAQGDLFAHKHRHKHTYIHTHTHRKPTQKENHTKI